MVVVPAAPSVTTPSASIVATVGSELDQVTVAPEIGLPSDARATAAEREPAAVPLLRSVLVMPEASIVVVVATAVDAEVSQ